jgi:uncharacterized protein YbjT (DUF2867 family)
MYLVTGSTGNIGKIIGRNLILNGKKVRVISRHEEKIKELYDMGAEAFVGDVTDRKFVLKAFEGITSAFCMIPTNLLSEDIRSYQRKIGQNYFDAVEEHRVKNVILLSSIGAHLRNGCGVVDGLADLEVLFSNLRDVNVLNLRPGFFMENIYSQIPMIKNSGIVGSAVKGDLKFPIVATVDIAAVIVRHLLELDFKGNSVEYVLGPKDLNYHEITNILSRAMDMQDLKYVQFTNENERMELVNSGMVSENVADAFIRMNDSFNSGEAFNAHTRTPENTTPTTFEDFARNVVYAYQHSIVS